MFRGGGGGDGVALMKIHLRRGAASPPRIIATITFMSDSHSSISHIPRAFRIARHRLLTAADDDDASRNSYVQQATTVIRINPIISINKRA